MKLIAISNLVAIAGLIIIGLALLCDVPLVQYRWISLSVIATCVILLILNLKSGSKPELVERLIDSLGKKTALTKPNLEQAIESHVVALADLRAERRMLIERAQDVICNITADGIIVRVSPSVRSLFGYEQEEFVNKSISDFIHSGSFIAHESFDIQVAQLSAAATFENQFRRKDGKIIDLLWSVYWSNTDKDFCCVAHDISERKALEQAVRENERRTRLILDALPVCVFIVLPNGRIEFCNATVQSVFGYTVESLRGRLCNEVFGDISIVSILDRQDITPGSPPVLAARKDGSIFPCEILSTRMAPKDGERYIIAVIDITERKQIEDLKDQFISMIGHDLRAPITSVRAFLGCLSLGTYGDLSAGLIARADSADKTLSRLLVMTNNLLDMERADARKLVMVREPTSFKHIVEEATSTLRPLFETAEIGLQVHIAGDVDLRADEERLIQVLINILSNALKYSERNTEVKVTAQVNNEMAICEVTDQGRGIPPDDLSRIFDRFHQVKDTDGKTGFGLGLYLCREIVQLHDGSITVESQIDHGSRFTISIPIKPQVH